MRMLYAIWENISYADKNADIRSAVTLSVLFMVLLLCAYEFLVYRFVSHRAFYNRSYNICVAVMPFFIATIILCLQSNIVITLGTIGALAILRFRTAIKDPVDMLYLLWSVHTGIVCGCQLFKVGILTSVVVTVVLLVLENISFGRRPRILAARSAADGEQAFLAAVAKCVKHYRVKSRNYSAQGIDFVVELTTDQTEPLAAALRELGVSRFSIIEYDSEDVF